MFVIYLLNNSSWYVNCKQKGIFFSPTQNFVTGQYHNFETVVSNKIVWCTVRLEETYKCQNLTVALERDRAIFQENFFNVTCHQAFNEEECIQLLDSDKANIMTLDAGEVFVAGRHNSLIPLMQEAYEGGFNFYYAVAVVKKGSIPEVASLRELRGKKACFSGVGSQAGWTIPIYTVSFLCFIKFLIRF